MARENSNSADTSGFTLTLEELTAEPAAIDTEFATPEDFFAVETKFDTLYIPELGKTVRVRYMNGKEVDAYRQSLMTGRGQNITIDQRGMRAKLAALALAKADGSRMFTDRDVPAIMQWQSIVLERIFDRARKINGLTDEDTDREEGNS